MRAELPNRILGRADEDTLLWCYAQRSGRAFDHVVDRLAAGCQPEVDVLADSGYIVRNSGTYDNGLRGTPTVLSFGVDHPLGLSHHTKMLALYLMREFSLRLPEHMARQRSADAFNGGKGRARRKAERSNHAVGGIVADRDQDRQRRHRRA